MTGLAAFKAHRGMLEGERAALVAVAIETSRLVGRETLQHRRPDAAVRIVAIHAAHGAFGKLVMKGRWNCAHSFRWQLAHSLLIASALRTTSGSLACILWQVVQAIWFLAWLLSSRPTCVG